MRVFCMHSGANRCLYACSRLVSILMPDRNKHIKRTKKKSINIPSVLTHIL